MTRPSRLSIAFALAALGLAALALAAPATAQQSTSTAALTTSDSASPFAWTPQPGDVIAFDVLRNGSKFGRHVIRFDGEPAGELTVTTDVELKAGLGPVTLFRYALDATETWRDGRLVRLDARTNDDGADEFVRAVATDTAIAVEGSQFQGEVSADIIPASHWNIEQIRSGRILSTETGEVLDIEVEALGRETLSIRGEPVEANRYRLRSAMDLDLWYDSRSRLVKLAFEARGQSIEYRLEGLY